MNMNQENALQKKVDALFQAAMNSAPVITEKVADAEDMPPGRFLLDEQTGNRLVMHGKPVVLWPAQSVLNMRSKFSHKLLCTGPTFNMGDACAYSCPYCYVEAATHGRFKAFLEKEGLDFQGVVIRREKASHLLKWQLAALSKEQRDFPHMIYSSTTVDVAANIALVIETAVACRLILELTSWEIRLLSKSTMLPLLISLIPKEFRSRLVCGVSTGTFDDALAQALETGTPLVSKRIESLHKLQDAGIRTFAMVCPSMPMSSVTDYEAFAKLAAKLLRYDNCEHVWAEVMNVRGENFTRTIKSLEDAKLTKVAKLLSSVSGVKVTPLARERWEEYARATFEAHATNDSTGMLRFLQYVDRDKDLPYWQAQEGNGAVILGTALPRAEKAAAKHQAAEASILSHLNED
jgi:DNA repair photolyase